MRRKNGTSLFSVQLLLGIIFSAIGIPFLIIGIYFALHMSWLLETATGSGDPRILPVLFSLIGGIFSALGIAFLIWAFRKNSVVKKVIKGGYSVTAVISEVTITYNVEINGSNPYVIVCQYQDPRTGILHIFRSKYIMFYPGDLTGRSVRVFVDPQNLNHYYVDLDSVLPQVEMH
ncbi:MAG: hypothetical protein U0L49_10930 [Eubacterium sp.]|nr:hypothetical protein [Eubacterium sp.]